MMRAVLLAILLVACGGSVEPEPNAPDPDCSKAYCSIVDDMKGVRCEMHPAEWQRRYDELCPPLQSFVAACTRRT